MIRHILRTGLALAAAAALAGCLGDSDSDEYGEDITRYDSNPAAGDPGTYPVQARNGRLERALVWLDMDGDQALSVYDHQDYEDDVLADADDETKARLDVDNSFKLTEPWGITDADGNLDLDVSALDLPESVAADLDPSDYSLMVVAVPGETRNGGELVDRAFFLSAPPGVSTVSPFTTLAETIRWLRGDSLDAAAAASRLQQENLLDAQEPVSIYQDYLNAQGATRAPHYATALRRLQQKQVTGALNGKVKKAVEDGLENMTPGQREVFFELNDFQVLGSVMLDQAANVIRAVDADIDARGVDGYALPADGKLDSIRNFKPDFDNPLVPVEQRYFTRLENPENEENFAPGALETGDNGDEVRLGRLTAEDAELNAQVFFDYGPGGRVSRISVRGQTRPSMSAFRFLSAGEDGGNPVDLGYAPYLDMETGPALDEAVERDALSSEVLDERFGEADGAIDWATPSIGLDSRWIDGESTDDHPDGRLERVYVEPDGAAALIRRPPLASGVDTVDASINVESEESGVPQIPIAMPVVGDQLKSIGSLSITYGKPGGLDECDNGTPVEPITHKQTVKVSEGSEPDAQPELTLTRYGHVPSGEDVFRVLAETYPAPVGDGVILREYEYPTDGMADANPDNVVQPDRILSVRALALDSLDRSARFCGDEGEAFSVSGSSANLQYYIGYEYMRFADYLESIGTRSQ
ncbi:hypothetical protein [Halospina sp. K52047b]|uniref:hypothetical protein n=1 Tax=Halospina sp. K52047b TaxID=2614160 RepID=UPI00124ACC4B|nr:hypothetical protein [Halospina sp. K52047b]KAA8980728.1 hypothetical protein F3089_10980 [Halospina sp. K52047b]